MSNNNLRPSAGEWQVCSVGEAYCYTVDRMRGREGKQREGVRVEKEEERPVEGVRERRTSRLTSWSGLMRWRRVKTGMEEYLYGRGR